MAERLSEEGGAKQQKKASSDTRTQENNPLDRTQVEEPVQGLRRFGGIRSPTASIYNTKITPYLYTPYTISYEGARRYAYSRGRAPVGNQGPLDLLLLCCIAVETIFRHLFPLRPLLNRWDRLSGPQFR